MSAELLKRTRERWQEAQEKLARVEGLLNEVTQGNCGIFDNIDEIKRRLAVKDDMLSALRVAETFIADELETRDNSFLPGATEEETGYIGEAQNALNTIRVAIARAEV